METMIPLLYVVGALGCPDGYTSANTGFSNMTFNSMGGNVPAVLPYQNVCVNATDPYDLYEIDGSSMPSTEAMCAVSTGSNTCCSTFFSRSGTNSIPDTINNTFTVICLDYRGALNELKMANENLYNQMLVALNGSLEEALASNKATLCPTSSPTIIPNITENSLYYNQPSYGVQCGSASSSSDLSTGAIVGIAVGSVAGVGLLGFGIYKLMPGSSRTSRSILN